MTPCHSARADGIADLGAKTESIELNNLMVIVQCMHDQETKPTATNLTVCLAASLLENSRGEIDMDIPISSTLDDPKSSLDKCDLPRVSQSNRQGGDSAVQQTSLGGGKQKLGCIKFTPRGARLTAEDERRMKS